MGKFGRLADGAFFLVLRLALLVPLMALAVFSAMFFRRLMISGSFFVRCFFLHVWLWYGAFLGFFQALRRSLLCCFSWFFSLLFIGLCIVFFLSFILVLYVSGCNGDVPFFAS